MANTNLRIDAERLWSTLTDTAVFGGTNKGGICRLALGPEDRQVRDWLAAAIKAAGLTLAVDDMGTMYGVRPGRDAARPPVAFGSHLDTQPTGGKFDGVLGVLAGLEVMRTLNDARVETQAPLCLINWTNEEGARFAPGMTASGVYAGEITKMDALALTDRDGTRFGDALAAIGYRGAEPVGQRRFSALVELHIEQGPILEAEGKTIGVVKAGKGIAWYNGKVVGNESHAGTTPMALRRDALTAFAEFALAVEAIAREQGPDAVGTIGVADVKPASRNTIPGEVDFTLEFRHDKGDALESLHRAAAAAALRIAASRKVDISLDRFWMRAPVHFDKGVSDAIAAAADAIAYSSQPMVSGAGHDACAMAAVCPTAMIFVPCKDGISHNEAEEATPADCAAGANVLLHTVLKLAG
jgi:beta-ureidopropionase / N-carbamoyl-L-amino-acid hydrolase